MAIPSGSGTEVLKRTSVINVGGGTAQATWWEVDWTSAQVTSASTYDVPAHHIITVLNVIICNNSTSSTYKVDMAITPSGGTIQDIIKNVSVGPVDTFVWNDKFVLSAGDSLGFRNNEDNSGDDFDIYISFIDQDWT